MKALILGSGSWGTAFGKHLASNYNEVVIWGIEPAQIDSINKTHTNPDFLGNTVLPRNLTASLNLTESVNESDVVFIVTPSQTIRSVVTQLKEAGLESHVPVVNMSKGLELGSLKRLSIVISESLNSGNPVGVLLGPSHAEEVAAGQPTAVVLSGTGTVWNDLQSNISSDRFRVYTNEDITGVEISSAFKNVLAIATGICDGLGYGDNTRGALLTRGLAELGKLGATLGGQESTFFGLSGIGDIITTCTSKHSRNRNFGETLVTSGSSPTEILKSSLQVVEGVVMTEAALKICEEYSMELPITQEVYKVLFSGKNPEAAITDLMARNLRAE